MSVITYQAPSNLELIWTVLQQAIPNGLSSLGLVLVAFVTTLFVSQQHDSAALGGVGVGSMLYNILGVSLGIGFSCGLDTLVSQSNGAGNYWRSGIHLQRAMVVCTLVCIPSFIILFLTEEILNAIGQDPAIAREAGAYVKGTCISLWPMYMSACINTFMRAQKLPTASVYATWISNGFHFLSCYFFITLMKMGSFGAGLAFSATQTLSFLILVGYVHIARPGVTKESWIPFDMKRSTRNLKSFTDKALPCAMLMWAEWWCSEVMTLLAGYLGVAALAAHTAVLQVFVLIFMTAGGLSCAGAALVGNAVGAADASLAKRSAKLATTLVIAASIIIGAVILAGRSLLASLFTKDPSVHATVMSLFGILLIIIPLDCLQTVIDGILRGVGKQSVAFKIKLVCMWGVRVPMAFYLGFYTSAGIAGIWWGSAIGLAVTMAIYVVLVLRINWDKEVSCCEAQGFTPQVPGLCRSPQKKQDPTAEDEEESSAGSATLVSPNIENCVREVSKV
jgi:MATE family multidrug resistance protein